jgi:hypothetical protein
MWDQIRDLLAELADVIITAAVAMSGVTGGDVEEAHHHLEQRLERAEFLRQYHAAVDVACQAPSSIRSRIAWRRSQSIEPAACMFCA